jgi:hypothetical protein
LLIQFGNYQNFAAYFIDYKMLCCTAPQAFQFAEKKLAKREGRAYGAAHSFDPPFVIVMRNSWLALM